MPPDLTTIIPLAALYAETHYRFRYFPFSLYFRRRPEVFFDAPHRLEPGEALPVLLLVKDAHRFPAELLDVTLTARGGGEVVEAQFPASTPLAEPMRHFIYYLDVTPLPPGEFTLEAAARLRDRKGEFHVSIDNHPGLTHAPLRIYKAFDPRPSFPGWRAGELHCHTEYGVDQVEFGAPLEYIQAGAQALGLSWAALTDHSYNLDDCLDNCLIDDPTHPKWQLLRDHAARLNAANPRVTLIPGEELTCRNRDGRNVHLLILGNDRFLPGSGDGAQKWLRARSELSVAEALAQLPLEVVAIAAHPLASTPPLEWLLVQRGQWQGEDLAEPRLDGWQVLNGSWDKGVELGLAEWSRSLDEGQPVRLFAGNDAHGNFNRFRQVKLPMMRLHEHDHHLFGKMTTWIRSDPQPGAAGVLRQLKHGPVCVSDGPALDISLTAPRSEIRFNETASMTQTGSVQVRYRTTPEFGTVVNLTLVTKGTRLKFKTGQREEKLSRCLSSWQDEFILPFKPTEYLRAELTTRDSKSKPHRALTRVITVDN